MSRSSSKVEFKNFIKGLIDVASPLNFPDNASYDEENFELNRDGTRNRRLGFNIESGGIYTSYSNSTYLDSVLPSIYKWRNAAGESDKDFLVVQDGNQLKLFDLSVSVLSTSTVVSLTLSSFPSNKRFSFASVDGRMVIVCGEPVVAIVSYENTTFSIEYVRLKTRDIWGVDTNSQYDSDDTYRGAYNPYHYYNLQNQSWGIPRRNKNNLLIDPAIYYFQTYGKYPSNSETVWPALQIQAVGSGNEPFERIWPNIWEEALGASVKSAKGYFIIDVVSRGSSRMTEFANNYVKYPQLSYSSVVLESDQTPGGANIVKEFAGRIFYSGFEGKVLNPNKRSPNLSNYVFFSQLVKSKRDYEKCYQAGDPTSRDSADVVDTDGGFIRIAGAEQIISMDVIGNSLLVFASNGVWSITGGSDFGFTATNYRVDKITSFGCIGARSIISDGSKSVYWSESGIYLISQSETGGLLASSLTENTIQNLYDSIDNSIKEKVIGVYDTLSKKVRWLIKEGTLFTSNSVTRELILDLSIGSFYKFKINNSSDNTFEVIQGFDSNRYNTNILDSSVISSTSSVISSASDVIVSQVYKTSSNKSVRYLILHKNGNTYEFSFGWYNNTNFKDWNEIDASAYLITGASSAGDMTSKKQIPYLFIAMLRTETGIDINGELENSSSCLFRTQWDWSIKSSSNKWSGQQQAYRLTRLHMNNLSNLSDLVEKTLLVTKNKTRGVGRSFAIRFDTEPGKDCKLAGWNVTLDATTKS